MAANPVFTSEPVLDGNAKLNLVTFVPTPDGSQRPRSAGGTRFPRCAGQHTGIALLAPLADQRRVQAFPT
jgi:hypothetical protein